MVAQPKIEGKLTKLFSLVHGDDSLKVASTDLANSLVLQARAPRGNSKAALSHTLTPDRPQSRKRNAMHCRHKLKWSTLASAVHYCLPQLFGDVYAYEHRIRPAQSNTSTRPDWINVGLRPGRVSIFRNLSLCEYSFVSALAGSEFRDCEFRPFPNKLKTCRLRTCEQIRKKPWEGSKFDV
jgi:hypothetical protein